MEDRKLRRHAYRYLCTCKYRTGFQVFAPEGVHGSYFIFWLIPSQFSCVYLIL